MQSQTRERPAKPLQTVWWYSNIAQCLISQNLWWFNLKPFGYLYKLVNHLYMYGFIILVQSYRGIHFVIVEPWEILKDFTTAKLLIKALFWYSISTVFYYLRIEWMVKTVTMACLAGLGEITHSTMVSNAADGKLIFVLNIIIIM